MAMQLSSHNFPMDKRYEFASFGTMYADFANDEILECSGSSHFLVTCNIDLSGCIMDGPLSNGVIFCV